MNKKNIIKILPIFFVILLFPKLIFANHGLEGLEGLFTLMVVVFCILIIFYFLASFLCFYGVNKNKPLFYGIGKVISIFILVCIGTACTFLNNNDSEGFSLYFWALIGALLPILNLVYVFIKTKNKI